MNSITISGTAHGINAESFALRVDSGYVNNSGAKVEQSFWVKVAGQYQGQEKDLVLVTGRLYHAMVGSNGTPVEQIVARSITKLAGSVDPQINSISILGNLGADPYQSSNANVCSMNVGINYAQDETVWARVSCFNKQAESVMAHKRKGHQVGVEGTLDVAYGYEANGEKAASLQMKAFRVQFCGTGASGSQANQAPAVADANDLPF